MDGWKKGWVDGCMVEPSTGVWMGEFWSSWVGGWMSRCMDRWMMAGWIDG